MFKHISTLLLASVCFSLAYSQESRDYLSYEEQYNKAVDLFQAKNYPAAYALFNKLLKENSELRSIPSEQVINAEMYYALSANYSGKQNGIILIEDFLDDYPAHPNTNSARLELAKYYFDNRNFDAALNHLQDINSNALSDEQLLEYNMSMGYAYFVKKQFQEAERHLQPVASGFSANRSEAIYYLALSQYFQQNYTQAFQNFSTIEDEPRYAKEIRFYKARILFEQEKYQEVIDFVETENISVENPALSQIIGQSYFNLEQYEQALPYLESYSQNTDAQSPEAQYQLAYTQYQLEQYSKAVKNFEKLNIVEDEIGQYALYALAESYLKINEKEKAKNAFARAAKMNYNQQIQENARYNEAKLSYELGRNNEAINLVKNFIDDYPQSKYRGEADEILVDLFLTSNNYKDALAVLNSIQNRSEKMDEAYQKVSYFRAVELYNNGELSQAKPLLDQVIEYPIDRRYEALANYWLGEMAYEYSRYPLSIDYLEKFQQSPVNKPEEYLSQANYTIGYANYKQKQYNTAANYFTKVSSSSRFKNDADLRAGDSYFAQRNYTSALKYYQSVAERNTTESDYANFQIAILNGLQGQTNTKLRKLRELYTQNSQSPYADDALFEFGRVFVTQENYPQAEESFLKLIADYPESEQVVNAYNQLGLINYNRQKYREAINYYDKIVREFPQSQEAGTALATIQEIYIEMGQPNEYFAYLETVEGVSIDASEQEQIIYQSAENQFQNGNCERAVEGFTDYLNKYPRSLYSSNAHFYRGECNNQNGRAEIAIEDYRAVAEMKDNKFTERSLIRLARYHYQSSQFEQSIEYYQRVLELQSNSTSIYQQEIMISLMQAYNKLNNRSRAATYAERVLQMNEVQPAIITEAEFTLAYQQYELGNSSVAQQGFEKIAGKTTNRFGAEARYLLARILHENNQHQQSIEACYRVADETPSEDDWVARSFILIADNYEALGELFQAKATLDSVIENYTGNNAEIISEAEQKRANIIAKEKNQSNLLNPGDSTNELQLQEN